MAWICIMLDNFISFRHWILILDSAFLPFCENILYPKVSASLSFLPRHKLTLVGLISQMFLLVWNINIRLEPKCRILYLPRANHFWWGRKIRNMAYPWLAITDMKVFVLIWQRKLTILERPMRPNFQVWTMYSRLLGMEVMVTSWIMGHGMVWLVRS